MVRTIKMGILIVLALILTTVTATASPITAVTQSFVSDDQFADSRFPDEVSPGNNPYGQYLWSGHQEHGNIHAYTFLKFEMGQDWNWQIAQLNLPFNAFSGNDGETSVWFNPNDSWTENDVTYENLVSASTWDWTNPLLLAREFVPGAYGDPVTPFSFDVSSIINFETNDVVSLVIGSILPNQIANGDYWRDMVNSEYYGGACSAKVVATNPVPEPATMLLLGLGIGLIISIAGTARRKKSIFVA